MSLTNFKCVEVSYGKEFDARKAVKLGPVDIDMRGRSVATVLGPIQTIVAFGLQCKCGHESRHELTTDSASDRLDDRVFWFGVPCGECERTYWVEWSGE